MTDKPIDWRGLHKRMKSLSEAQLAALLEEEMTVHRRWQIAERLHQRLSRLRTDRERIAILTELA